MAERTEVEYFDKQTFTLAQVQAARQVKLDGGAKSSTISEEPTRYVLTTLWDF